MADQLQVELVSADRLVWSGEATDGHRQDRRGRHRHPAQPRAGAVGDGRGRRRDPDRGRDRGGGRRRRLPLGGRQPGLDPDRARRARRATSTSPPRARSSTKHAGPTRTTTRPRPPSGAPRHASRRRQGFLPSTIPLPTGRTEGEMAIWQWLARLCRFRAAPRPALRAGPRRTPSGAVPPRRHLRALRPRPGLPGRARLGSRARALRRRARSSGSGSSPSAPRPEAPVAPAPSSTYESQRQPEGSEQFTLYGGHVVVACRTPTGRIELAMSPSALTGLPGLARVGTAGSRPARPVTGRRPAWSSARNAVALSFLLNGFAFASWISRIPETRVAGSGSTTAGSACCCCASRSGRCSAMPSAGRAGHQRSAPPAWSGSATVADMLGLVVVDGRRRRARLGLGDRRRAALLRHSAPASGTSR